MGRKDYYRLPNNQTSYDDLVKKLNLAKKKHDDYEELVRKLNEVGATPKKEQKPKHKVSESVWNILLGMVIGGVVTFGAIEGIECIQNNKEAKNNTTITIPNQPNLGDGKVSIKITPEQTPETQQEVERIVNEAITAGTQKNSSLDFSDVIARTRYNRFVPSLTAGIIYETKGEEEKVFGLAGADFTFNDNLNNPKITVGGATKFNNEGLDSINGHIAWNVYQGEKIDVSAGLGVTSYKDGRTTVSATGTISYGGPSLQNVDNYISNL